MLQVSEKYTSFWEDNPYKFRLFNWIFSTDHKRIGLMYMVSMFTFFLVGVALAFSIKLEKFFPGTQLYGPEVYNSVFTIHGVVMIFLFVIPGLPAIFGNFFLPILLGAKDVAFPKLNLISYYLFIFGALMVVFSLFGGSGPLDTGWTFTVPYSATSDRNIVIPLLAAFILGWGTILTAINFIVTIHRMRAPGMKWFQMPLFAWSLYATSWIQVLATPVIGITLLLLALERVLPFGFFDPTKGGDPILFQHLFWIYSHPAVYVMILPAMGAISEIIPVFSQRTIFGYKSIVFSTLAIAAVGYFVWAHHMFVTGMSVMGNIIFSFLTFWVAVPTAVKVFNWVASMYKGSIKLDPPMMFALGFIFLFSIGGLSGLVLGALAPNVHLHDTDFVVGHFHYTMFGGAAMGLFAAVHYWFPKMFGKMYSHKTAYVAWGFIFVGFNVLYFSMMILGFMGMPRRYHDYLPQFHTWQFISSTGAVILVTGLVIMIINWVWGARKGAPANANPWGGLTLEWQLPPTPSKENFEDIPKILAGPYEYSGTVETPKG